MENELKPCPFEKCKSDDIVVIDNEGGVGYRAFCCSCASSGPIMEYSDQAIAAWNARAGGWRDIESAPKNEEVLVWNDWQDSAYLAICKANEYETYEWWVPDTDTSQGGWVELLASPTHWQPLPAPPDSPLKGRKEGEE